MARYKRYDYNQMMMAPVSNEIDLFFTKALLVWEEEELPGGTPFSLDGLKLSSNAAKEWSGTFSDLRKKQEALSRKVKEAISEHREADKREDGKSATDRQRFEKRIKRLKQKAENIEEFLAENEPKIGWQLLTE